MPTTSQAGMRLYNERLALSLIRHHGRLSKADLARRTGLSTQASAVIMRQLEEMGLLLKDSPRRQGVGQPSTPMRLNPEGAFAIGCKVGRRSVDLVLMDFVGTVRATRRRHYAYPVPEVLESFLQAGLADLMEQLTPAQRPSLCGLGIAAPQEMWSWDSEASLPREVAALWRNYDLKAGLGQFSAWPVLVTNDATAGCAAELVFGNRPAFRDFLYVFIGTLVGGGVVLDGSLYAGRAGYAGALGSIFVGGTDQGEPKRLIRTASLYVLEALLRAEGRDSNALFAAADWSPMGAALTRWIAQATDALAVAIGSAVSVIDFEAVVIDGGFPAAIRAEIVAQTRAKLADLDMQGTAPVEVVEGAVGPDARSRGAASLPLLAAYSQDRHVLFEKTKQ